jgi:formate hydrogenlyase subunit 6/NADH:ubiquinone oxidoreductase subunit I
MESNVVLQTSQLRNFLDRISSHYDVYIPVKKRNQRFFKKYASSVEEALIGEVRTFEPLKAFFSRAREQVAEGFQAEPPVASGKPLAIVGVKACDLKGFKIQDFVFKDNGVQDPFYVRNREENLIISADCTCVIATCFCRALGVEPYPQDNFDLNFSPVEDGFVVKSGSAKGEALLHQHASLFRKATVAQLQARDAQRARVTQEVEENLKKFEVPRQDRFRGIIEKNWSASLWEEEAKTCVECGACNQICPTCHCFLLYDQKDGERTARLRVWDSCLLKDYARVAGGANPRKRLWMRLRNRFDKKFDFFPKVAQVYACTGCGRCISACPAKIDIRRVLRRLVQSA